MNATTQPTPRNSQPLHVGPLAPTKIYTAGEHGPTEVATTLLQGDARRIALCWNACTGASNSSLETITKDGGGIAKVMSTMMDEIAALKPGAATATTVRIPRAYKREWPDACVEAYKLLRKQNHTIPSHVLQAMLDILLEAQ